MSARAAVVWITRAQPAAAATGARVAALGFTPLVEPLLQVRRLAPALDLADVAALAFTSANGVGAFADLRDERHLPVFAVGEATAEAARAAGFAEVRSAGGDVAALADLIAAAPPAGPVLHAAARRPAGDLAGALAARGVTARSAAVYETVATPAAGDPAAAGEAGIVLLHSPRAARLLAALVGRRPRASLRAACLSPSVAAALDGALPAAAAATPDERALLALLREMAR